MKEDCYESNIVHYRRQRSIGRQLICQDAGEKSPPRNPAQAAAQTNPLSSKAGSGDTQQLRADLQQLKVLLNQMRTNLAFVQTTQTPLKHQFELETDAWIVDQMERREFRHELIRESTTPRHWLGGDHD